jgi:hypothetical protein
MKRRTDEDDLTPEQIAAMDEAVQREELRLGRPLTVWESLRVAGASLRKKAAPCGEPQHQTEK